MPAAPKRCFEIVFVATPRFNVTIRNAWYGLFYLLCWIQLTLPMRHDAIPNQPSYREMWSNSESLLCRQRCWHKNRSHVMRSRRELLSKLRSRKERAERASGRASWKNEPMLVGLAPDWSERASSANCLRSPHQQYMFSVGPPKAHILLPTER